MALCLEMKVKVAYEPNGLSDQEIADNLEQSLIQAVDNGLLTGDTAAEVGSWQLTICKRKRFLWW